MDWDYIKGLIFVVIFLSVIGLVIYTGVSMNLHADKDNKFCEENYPSTLRNGNYNTIRFDWGTHKNIEEGYIQCCRRYLKEHEYQTQCKIFNDTH